MLREEMNIRQIEGEPRRRWFADEFFDLIVWLEPDGAVWGFQLCYDRGYKPRALTWTKDRGYTHNGIDDGEGDGGAIKGSPVLVQDGLFNAKTIGERLAAAAGELPPETAAFIMKKVNKFKL